MRTTAAALLILAAAVWAAPAKALQRSLERAAADLERGRAEMVKAALEKKVHKKLHRLERAADRFRSARRIARSSQTRADKAMRPAFERMEELSVRGLVDSLNEQTWLHWTRKAVSTARKRNAEALKLLPKDPEALRLRHVVKKTRARDGDAGYEPGFDARRAARYRHEGLRHRLRTHDRRAPPRR